MVAMKMSKLANRGLGLEFPIDSPAGVVWCQGQTWELYLGSIHFSNCTCHRWLFRGLQYSKHSCFYRSCSRGNGDIDAVVDSLLGWTVRWASNFKIYEKKKDVKDVLWRSKGPLECFIVTKGSLDGEGIQKKGSIEGSSFFGLSYYMGNTFHMT